MNTRDFSFGVSVLEYELPDELRTVLEWWTNEFSTDSFAEGVSSKGVKAWAVRHEEAVQHQDLLGERLRAVCSELALL